MELKHNGHKVQNQIRCIYGPNWETLIEILGDLSYGQIQNEVKFDFQVKFDLKGQGRSPPKRIGTLAEVFCTSGPKFVILPWTGDELSHGQAHDYYTHTHRLTHRRRRWQYLKAKTGLGYRPNQTQNLPLHFVWRVLPVSVTWVSRSPLRGGRARPVSPSASPPAPWRDQTCATAGRAPSTTDACRPEIKRTWTFQFKLWINYLKITTLQMEQGVQRTTTPLSP